MNRFCFLCTQGVEVFANPPRGPEQRTDQGQTEVVPRGVQLRCRDGTGFGRRRREPREFRVLGDQISVSKHSEVAAEEYQGSSGLRRILIRPARARIRLFCTYRSIIIFTIIITIIIYIYECLDSSVWKKKKKNTRAKDLYFFRKVETLLRFEVLV